MYVITRVLADGKPYGNGYESDYLGDPHVFNTKWEASEYLETTKTQYFTRIKDGLYQFKSPSVAFSLCVVPIEETSLCNRTIVLEEPEIFELPHTNTVVTINRWGSVEIRDRDRDSIILKRASARTLVRKIDAYLGV